MNLHEKIYIFILILLTVIIRSPFLIKPFNDEIIFYSAAVNLFENPLNLIKMPILYSYTIGLPLLLSLFFNFLGESLFTIFLFILLSDCFLIVMIYLFLREFINTKFAFFSSLFFLFQRDIMFSGRELNPIILSLFFLLVSIISLLKLKNKFIKSILSYFF